MTTEPQRLQYLEAMGLTAWTARYRLPNARPTEACEWEMPEPESATRQAPAERLQALLETPAEPASVPSAPQAEPRDRPAGPRKARALLGGLAPEAAPVDDAPVAAPGSEAAEATPPQEALRFTLQVACLDGRWLVVLPGAVAPSPVAGRLLANLLRAAGVTPERLSSFESFHWPQIEGVPVQAPLDEARQGLAAFLAGRARRGWAPERLLVFGDDAALTRVLAIEDERSTALDLPVWQAPSLDALAASAEAKRALWPRLAAWRTAWQGDMQDAVGTEAGRDA